MTAPPPEELRSYADPWRTLYSEVGRTCVENYCPFCADTVRAFLWSLCGSGKRCRCGAVLGFYAARKRRP